MLLLATIGYGAPALALSGPSPSAASAQTLKLPDGPASVHGLSDAASINVFSGQVAYSVPIDLPKGPGAFGPSLALSYSGELGNGPVGIGWSFGEISIRRSLRLGVPTYTDADELDLVGVGNGGRLISVGADEYRVEGEGNTVRAFRHGDQFEVIDGSGTKYVLGVTQSTREQDGSRIAAWFAETITNIAGQQITLEYSKDQNEVYLEHVLWATNNVYQVDLVYDGRPDLVTSYRGGFAQVIARRLVRVDVFTDFSNTRRRMRSYQLFYDDDTFPVTRMTRIRMSGTDDTLSLPDLTFQYGRPEPAVVTPLSGTAGWQLNQRGVSFADVDGDGAPDLLRLEAGNHVSRRNVGGQFVDGPALQGADDADLESVQLMDLDGDARPELVRIVNDTWRAYHLDGTTWTSMGEWPGTNGVPLRDPVTVLCDVNADGRTDVVRASTHGITVYFNGATGLQPPVSLPPISAADVSVQPGDPNVRFVDMNGDGVVDVVWLTDAWMKIFLGKGDGTFTLYDRVLNPWGTVSFSATDIQLVDLNRDGLMDVVRISGGHVYWYPGLANAHFSDAVRHVSSPEASSVDAVVTIADANGNGSPDVVWSSPRGMWALDLAGSTTAGMLTEIDNGLGKTTQFLYRSSASLAAAAELANAPWTHKLPNNIPVAVRMEIDPGAGGPLRVKEFSVRDGVWDGVERRMGGFLLGRETTIDADGPADTLIQETHYEEGMGSDRELRGRVSSTTVSDDLGNLFITTKTDWTTLTAAGLDPANPLLRKAVMTQTDTAYSENVVSSLVTRTTYSEFDGEARPTVEEQMGRIDRLGDEKVIHRSFGDDSTLWVRDKMIEETVTDEAGAIFSSSRTYYGARSGGPLPLGQVSEGYVREVDGLVNPGNRWVPQSTHDYDSCGNAVHVTENGVSRQLGYDANCLHPLTETITSASGPVPLTWSMAWNDVLAVPQSITDPTGDVSTVSYDGLGRQISLAVNSACAHVHFAYDWQAPLPKTTTWSFDGSSDDFATECQTWPAGTHWRARTSVTNGAGEGLYTSTPVGGRYLIGDWVERDERGQTILAAEAFYSSVAFPTAVLAGTRAQVMDHDAQGRMRRQVLPNGAVKTISYRALGQTVFTDDLGPVSSDVDGLLRIAHAERSTGVGTETIDATFDPADRILALTLQGGLAVQTYTYDTLGRLIHAEDPDIGARDLVWDDGNFLKEHTNGAGQSTFFDYDGAGRMIRRGDTAAPSAPTDYVFNYDVDDAAMSTGCRVASRLAGVTEPNGEVRFCFNQYGKQTGMARTVTVPDGSASGSALMTFSPSGLPLTEVDDDGFTLAYRYDSAGRTVAVSSEGTDLWKADGPDEIDAVGRVTNEHYGNGNAQSYGYDALGLSSHIEIDQSGTSTRLYDVTIQRNSYGAPQIVTDQDGRGLDHTATFSYDDAGRLTGSTLGPDGPDQFKFTYTYDLLQNMVSRGASGPKDIGVLTGQYKYGERGYGPRQLTSVVP